MRRGERLNYLIRNQLRLRVTRQDLAAAGSYFAVYHAKWRDPSQNAICDSHLRVIADFSELVDFREEPGRTCEADIAGIVR